MNNNDFLIIKTDNQNKLMPCFNESDNSLNKKFKELLQQNQFVINTVSNSFVSSLQNPYNELLKDLRLDYLRGSCLEPIISMQEKLMKISIPNLLETINPMHKIIESIMDAIKPNVDYIASVIPHITPFFSGLSEVLEKIKNDPDNILNWLDYTDKLCEYIWTIPYQISSEELNMILTTVNSEKEFDTYMLKYFTKGRTEELFDEITIKTKLKHRKLMKQIRLSYFDGRLALANVGMLSIVDELCSSFLFNKGYGRRQNLLLPIIEKIDNTSNNPFEVLPITMLNKNLNTIYEDIDFNGRISIKTNKKVRRNPCQHGQSFSNRKIDSLMLLNTMYYLLIITENYKQYIGKIIFVKKDLELKNAETDFSQEIKRFYIKKRYARVKK